MNSNFEKADHEIVLLFHLKLNIIYVFYGDDFAVCENQASPGVIDFGYVSGKGVISAALFFGVWNKVGDRDLWALGKLRLKIMELDVQKLFLRFVQLDLRLGQTPGFLCSRLIPRQRRKRRKLRRPVQNVHRRMGFRNMMGQIDHVVVFICTV